MFQEQNSRQFANLIDAWDFREVRKSNCSRGRLFFLDLLEERNCLGFDAGPLLVNESGIEPEAGVFELEIAPRFGNTPFAKKKRLLAIGQSFANDRPFFESIFQHDSPFW